MKTNLKGNFLQKMNNFKHTFSLISSPILDPKIPNKNPFEENQNQKQTTISNVKFTLHNNSRNNKFKKKITKEPPCVYYTLHLSLKRDGKRVRVEEKETEEALRQP